MTIAPSTFNMPPASYSPYPIEIPSIRDRVVHTYAPTQTGFTSIIGATRSSLPPPARAPRGRAGPESPGWPPGSLDFLRGRPAGREQGPAVGRIHAQFALQGGPLPTVGHGKIHLESVTKGL